MLNRKVGSQVESLGSAIYYIRDEMSKCICSLFLLLNAIYSVIFAVVFLNTESVYSHGDYCRLKCFWLWHVNVCVIIIITSVGYRPCSIIYIASFSRGEW